MEIIRAAYENDVQFIWKHLNKENANATAEDGTPLIFIAADNRPEILASVLALGVSPIATFKGCIPLHKSCLVGSRKCMKILLGAYFGATRMLSDTGWSPVHYLIQGMESRGEHDFNFATRRCYDILTVEECTVNSLGVVDIATPPPLYFAVRNGWRNMSAQLIHDGADVNIMPFIPQWLNILIDGMWRGTTAAAAWVLCFKSFSDQSLKRRKTSVNKLSQDIVNMIAHEIWKTRLSRQWVNYRQRGLIDNLVCNTGPLGGFEFENGVSDDDDSDEEFDLDDPDDETQVIIDAVVGNVDTVLRMQLTPQNVTNFNYHETILTLVTTHYRELDVVKLAIDRGADPTLSDRLYNQLPLHCSCWYADFDIVCLLLRLHPTGVHHKDHHGETPLHSLASYPSSAREKRPLAVKCCHLLLEYGAKIDTFTDYGKTPLFFAIQSDQRELAAVLYDRGAKIENVRVGHRDKRDRYKIVLIPSWMRQIEHGRFSCEDATCAWLLIVNRRFRHRGQVCITPGCICYDLGILIAKEVWSTRLSNNWAKDF